MISDRTDAETYVWIWLPGAEEPVVAGRLTRSGSQLLFNYGRSYLARPDAIALYAPELPLQAGELPLLPGLSMPACIRDASPDAWGRRVLINRRLGQSGDAAAGNIANVELDELAYLLESGSDRIGALDFQRSATQYVARGGATASLDELSAASDMVQQGVPLTAELAQALQHGTSIGGARPKAPIEDGKKKFIAKFSAGTDTTNVVKAEFVAMRLAKKVGLNAAGVQLTRALGRDVLLIERFDRVRSRAHWQRRAMVSALTLLELDEMMAAYASYENLAHIVRHRFTDPKETLHELFGRIVFNILCGNTDDHARNHAAFWDGAQLTLTPAYDICPQSRTGQEASQAMLIHGSDRRSQIATCIAGAAVFTLSAAAAIDIVNRQVATIKREWEATCKEAGMNEVERRSLWGRQFLNPYGFFEVPKGVRLPGA